MAEPDGVTVEYQPDSSLEDGVVELSPPPLAQPAKGTPLSPASERKHSLIPILFERSAKSWWNPKFDSKTLEEQHINSSFPLLKRRFQYALGFVIVACVAWCIFFGVKQRYHWVSLLAGAVVLLVIAAAILGFTIAQVYSGYVLHTSVVTTLILCLFCLLNYAYDHPDLSLVGTFTMALEILLMMYTVIPLPLYLCVLIGAIFSTSFELLSGFLAHMTDMEYVIGRALIHVCIHLIGIHIHIMLQVRTRSTFLKVGQSITARKEMELEKLIKHQMIHSLMPPTVAQEVMRSREEQKEDEEDLSAGKRHYRQSDGGSPDRGQMTFRSFHMSQMDNVSILFADIVGFTKMSSNKTAEHLVSLLNDLFGRFDQLCSRCDCEKISTLGDCYYCVSGCPKPRPDHARCCAEMGLAMCKAIIQFDEDHNESVNMRVGVHTGTVLCGLVGTRRFKFDVWSHDVTLANMMESEGRPGQVHVSASTHRFIESNYTFELGDEVEDIRKHKVLTESYDPNTQQYIVKHIQDKDTIKTYFITGRREVPVEEGDAVAAAERDAAGQNGVNAIPEVKVTVEGEETIKNMSECQELFPFLRFLDAELKDPPSTTNQPSDSSLSNTHHVEAQSEAAHDISTTALLNKRDAMAASLENLKDVDADLMDKLQLQRTHAQTDHQLIKNMRSEPQRVQEYLYRPPINQCTLNFKDAKLERNYRKHYLEDSRDAIRTFALPRFSALCDMLISVVFYVLIAVCCFLGFPVRWPWLLVFAVGLVSEVLVLMPLLCNMCTFSAVAPSLNKVGQFVATWYPRHVAGCVVACLPALAVYSNFQCELSSNQGGIYFCLLLVVSLMHFCNFTMLSSWLKSSLATVVGIILVVLLSLKVCEQPRLAIPDNATVAPGADGDDPYPGAASDPLDLFAGVHYLRHEIIMNVALLLLLMWFLNREFEISYRLCFHGDQQAAKDRSDSQKEKEQADWLLHNIIPEHVEEVMKATRKQYCQNHHDVGVIFAKIANYDDFYDESFEGGKEYLRVLNELIGDFEDLFDEAKYKDVEKIKTIGSCLMAATGLNNSTRCQNKDPNAHLYALMDFSTDLLGKLEEFNAEIFNFNFEMMIGFNIGEVTSGLIGTTKLLYDIWGDTVNISSRMYSTGVHGRIQVTEDTANRLGDKFEFEYRGKTFVKGKGDMNTYLLVKKKEGATWN